jgi:hypothetical protein
VLQILEARAAHGEGRGGFRVFRSPRRTNPPGVSLYLFTVNARLVIGDRLQAHIRAHPVIADGVAPGRVDRIRATGKQ